MHNGIALIFNGLRLQIGPDKWENIEKIRAACINFRNAESEEEAVRLHKEIERLIAMPLAEQLNVIRAFTYYRYAPRCILDVIITTAGKTQEKVCYQGPLCSLTYACIMQPLHQHRGGRGGAAAQQGDAWQHRSRQRGACSA